MRLWPYMSVMFAAIISGGPSAPPGAQLSGGLMATLEATSANVAASGTPVRIELFRWSSESERRALVAAFDPEPVLNPTPLAIPGSRGGGGGGRGREAAFAPTDPTEAFMAALSRAPTLGYIWTDEVVGYSVRYAHRVALPDGGERIWLLTNRRLGESSPRWRLPSGVTPTDYAFTLLEARLDPSGQGTARASLAVRVVHDRDAGLLTLVEDAGDAPVLENLTYGAPRD